MKIILLSVVIMAVSFTAVAQIGIGTTSPEGALDVVSTNSGLVIPRVASTASVTTPVNGMLIYDISASCTKSFENGAWTACLNAANAIGVAAVISNCALNGFEGAYVNGIAVSDAKFTVTINNNSFSAVTLNFGTSDLILSGVTGITVNAVSPTSVTLSAGQSQLVTYILSGTPESVGTLSGNWTKQSLTCANNKNVLPRNGSSPALAGVSCKAILDGGLSIGDGLYWINPTGSSTFQVHCDMTTDGGGWTLVVTRANNTNRTTYSTSAGSTLTDATMNADNIMSRNSFIDANFSQVRVEFNDYANKIYVYTNTSIDIATFYDTHIHGSNNGPNYRYSCTYEGDVLTTSTHVNHMFHVDFVCGNASFAWLYRASNATVGAGNGSNAGGTKGRVWAK